MKHTPRENRASRSAKRLGLTLRRIPERSRDYALYGPFMLVATDTNGVVARGLDLGGVEDELLTRAG